MPLDYFSRLAVFLRGRYGDVGYMPVIIAFTRNLKRAPYSEVIQGSTKFKQTGG